MRDNHRLLLLDLQVIKMLGHPRGLGAFVVQINYKDETNLLSSESLDESAEILFESLQLDQGFFDGIVDLVLGVKLIEKEAVGIHNHSGEFELLQMLFISELASLQNLVQIY